MHDQNTKRSLLANSAYIFLIRFFPGMATFLSLLLVMRHADRAFNGIYQQFWVQWQVYNVIACLGLPAVLITWPVERINRLVSGFSLRFALILSGWLVLICLVFGLFQFPGYTLFYALFSCVFLLVTAITAILEAYLINARRFNTVLTGSLVYSVLYLSVHILFIRHELDMHDLFLYLFGGALIRCLLLFAQGIVYYQRTFVKEDWPPLPIESVRSLWFHLGLYDVLQTAFRWGDKFILSALLSSELFAIYCAGTTEIPFLALLLGAVGSALLMRLNHRDTTDEERVLILRQSGARLSQVVFPLFFYLVIFRQEIFKVVLTNRFEESVPLFLISCLVVPLRSYNFTSILQHKGKGRIINVGAVGDLAVALLLMYPLYRLMRLEGVALAFVISTYFQAGFYLYHTARLLGCRMTDLLPLRKWAVQGIVLFVVFIALYYSLHYVFDAFYVLFLGGIVTGVLMGWSVVPLMMKRKRHA